MLNVKFEFFFNKDNRITNRPSPPVSSSLKSNIGN